MDGHFIVRGETKSAIEHRIKAAEWPALRARHYSTVSRLAHRAYQVGLDVSSYRIETSQTEGRWVARLFDGTTPVVSVVVTAEPSNEDEIPEEVASPSAFERRDAAVRLQQDIFPGLQISGIYPCNVAALATLAARS